jgi:hypothetical protein
MPLDSSEIDNALMAKLLGDATLQGLMPDGVYWGVAAPGRTRFVIVSLVIAQDVQQFVKRSYEDVLYVVKAVASSMSGGDVKAAAARIDALLENGTLSIPGYALMTLYREERIRDTEFDDVDSSIRWQHRGGRYRLMASGQ